MGGWDRGGIEEGPGRMRIIFNKDPRSPRPPLLLDRVLSFARTKIEARSFPRKFVLPTNAIEETKRGITTLEQRDRLLLFLLREKNSRQRSQRGSSIIII